MRKIILTPIITLALVLSLGWTAPNAVAQTGICETTDRPVYLPIVFWCGSMSQDSREYNLEFCEYVFDTLYEGEYFIDGKLMVHPASALGIPFFQPPPSQTPVDPYTPPELCSADGPSYKLLGCYIRCVGNTNN